MNANTRYKRYRYIYNNQTIFQLRLFRDNHNYAKASMKHYFSFLRNDEDEYTRLYIVWGLHPVDISNCDLKSAAYCRGTPVLDEKFDMNIPEAQVAFKVRYLKYSNNVTPYPSGHMTFSTMSH